MGRREVVRRTVALTTGSYEFAISGSNPKRTCRRGADFSVCRWPPAVGKGLHLLAVTAAAERRSIFLLLVRRRGLGAAPPWIRLCARRHTFSPSGFFRVCQETETLLNPAPGLSVVFNYCLLPLAEVRFDFETRERLVLADERRGRY